MQKYLGIEYLYTNAGIYLHQATYAAEISEEFHNRTKHFKVHYHFLRVQSELENIEIVHIPTSYRCRHFHKATKHSQI